jgi:hypothetical protein
MANERGSFYFGVVEREGLTSPAYLESFTPLSITVEEHPDSEEPLWHIYLLKVQPKHIDSAMTRFSAHTKPGWYSIFWNEQNTHVVLESMIISLPKEDKWQSDDYLSMQKLAAANGIQAEYLDLNKNFKDYEKLIAESGN